MTHDLPTAVTQPNTPPRWAKVLMYIGAGIVLIMVFRMYSGSQQLSERAALAQELKNVISACLLSSQNLSDTEWITLEKLQKTSINLVNVDTVSRTDSICFYPFPLNAPDTQLLLDYHGEHGDFEYRMKQLRPHIIQRKSTR